MTIGCNFYLWDEDYGLWNLTYLTVLRDSNNNVVDNKTGWVHEKSAISGTLTKLITNPDSLYYCDVDWYVDATYIGHDQIPIPVQVPTSLSVYTQTTDMCGNPPTCRPPGCNPGCQAYYYKYRHYQVLDASQQPINKVMVLDEDFTTPTNTCSATFLKASATTNTAGVFTDTFFFYGNSICDASPPGSCTVQRNQTWKEKASTNTVGSFVLTYTCTSVSIQ